MGPKTVEIKFFKSGPRPLGRVKRNFLGQFGPVLTRFQPFWPIRRDARLGDSSEQLARDAFQRMDIHLDLAMSKVDIVHTWKWWYFPTANRHQPPTDNHQPPTAINR